MGFMKERNKSPWKGAFVDNDYLDTTFESQDIEQIVREDFPDMENKRLESLCTTIRTHRRKTFAILIIREMTERILELPEDNVSLHDEALFNAPFQTSSAYSRDSFPWTSFSTDISDVLYDGQWRIPPRLSRTHHQFFPVKDFIFPFTSVPSHIGQGTFGDVYKIDIAEGHIEYKKGYTSVSNYKALHLVLYTRTRRILRRQQSIANSKSTQTRSPGSTRGSTNEASTQ